MEGGGARNVSAAAAAQTKGSGVDESCKPLPPCCVKAKAAVPESEAKCHATVVSGWFTEPRSRSGTYVFRLVRYYCIKGKWELQGHTKFSAVLISKTKLLHFQVKQEKCSISTIQCGLVFPDSYLIHVFSQIILVQMQFFLLQKWQLFHNISFPRNTSKLLNPL